MEACARDHEARGEVAFQGYSKTNPTAQNQPTLAWIGGRVQLRGAVGRWRSRITRALRLVSAVRQDCDAVASVRVEVTPGCGAKVVEGDRFIIAGR
jgi:hypothetical protein